MNYSSPHCFINEPKPVCPYCGYIAEDAQEIHASNLGWSPDEEIKVECPQCENKYLIAWSISYDTSMIDDVAK